MSISNSDTKYCLRNEPIIKMEPINRCVNYPAFIVTEVIMIPIKEKVKPSASLTLTKCEIDRE